MTSISISLLILIFLVFILLMTKLHQLRKLEKMNSKNIIDFVTKNDDQIKISFAILKEDKITYQIYGKNSELLENTTYNYEIGSISKTFVGLMLSKAIDENKIDMNASISEYLPLDKHKYYPTIERLITHTSGYKNYYFNKQMLSNQFHQGNDFYGIHKSKLLDKIERIDLQDKRYKFKYSNFGISIIGLVLEKVYEKDFVTLMQDFIDNDLQFTKTNVAIGTGNLNGYWKWKDDDGYIPAGSIISNIEEMARYLKYQINDKDHYINKTHTAITSIHANNFLYEKLNIRMDKIGMTWMIDEKNDIVWHNGGTSKFNSYIAFNKNKQIGVIVLGNTSPIKKVPMTVIGAKLMNELTMS